MRPPFLLAFALCLAASAAQARQPNVVVILTDDQGWGDLSFNGNRNLQTPNIDRLARSGASFDRFFVCPVCSPTRAEFLTGRYHPRSGVYSTSAGGERIDLDEETIAEQFQVAGYATAAFGKWHNGMQFPYHPRGRGFDEFYGFCSGHWGNYFNPPLERNGRIVRGKGFCVDDFTSHALSFMEANKDRPFFVYLPLNTPHSPMQVPDRWWNKFKDKQLAMHNRQQQRERLPHIRAALAMCENIDWNVGRIVDKLRQLSLEDDTIVVYFCDNGPNGYRWNGDMKGRKGSTDEGGVRSPLFIRWPQKIAPGKRIRQIASAIDLLPTLSGMAGVKSKPKKSLDGKDMKGFLLGDRAVADRMIFSHWRGRVSVRTQQFRLDHRGQLFDLERDPGQRAAVTDQHPRTARKLKRAVAAWRAEVLDKLGQDDRPFPIGHKRFAFTQLPARDAKVTGGIRRSNRFPNCSYFTNWTNADDRITWDTEVMESGTYHVDVYYACPESDVGSTIELRVGESRLVGRVTRPHDPPVRGGEHDRVKRQESYVRDFKPFRLGQIQLSKGRSPMTLRATKIPGKQVMDFRLLMLTRVDKK